jgi:hypothetical protein
MTADGLPETREELCAYIVCYAEAIRVRHDGQTRALTDLPVKEALTLAFTWVVAGEIPFRKLCEAEIQAKHAALKEARAKLAEIEERIVAAHKGEAHA